MTITVGDASDDGAENAPRPVVHGSASEGVGAETLGLAVDVPWDLYLGGGAAQRVRDGSLGVVRHAYPAQAAHDVSRCATATGQLLGGADDHERIAAIGLGVAAIRHRPARMPHRPGDEPHAWWIAEERTLVWMPWADIDEAPYGMALIDAGDADSVVILAPDAIWTVYASGLPAAGSRGVWADLPERLQRAIAARTPDDLSASVWRREGDTVTVRWKTGNAVRSASIAVNRLRYLDAQRHHTGG